LRSPQQQLEKRVNTPESEFTIRHVLVALDASAHSLAALEIATDLAAIVNAELIGLFVEDAQLLRLARSPHAREVVYPFAELRPLNIVSVKQRLEAQAEQARRSMASLANPAKVRWSFRVVRGEVDAEVLAAASDMDVLALGKTGWSLAAQAQLGSTALAAAHHAPRALLMVQRGLPFKRQVLALVDGDENSQPTLIAALRLAQAYGNRLVVLIATTRASTFKERSHKLSALLKQESEHLHVHFRQIPGNDLLSIAHAIRVEGGGILAINATACSTETVNQLLHHLDNPILLVR